MKKRLLVAYVASTLAGIGGISSAALTSTNGAPRPGGIWTDPPEPGIHRVTPSTPLHQSCHPKAITVVTAHRSARDSNDSALSPAPPAEAGPSLAGSASAPPAASASPGTAPG